MRRSQPCSTPWTQQTAVEGVIEVAVETFEAAGIEVAEEVPHEALQTKVLGQHGLLQSMKMYQLLSKNCALIIILTGALLFIVPTL